MAWSHKVPGTDIPASDGRDNPVLFHHKEGITPMMASSIQLQEIHLISLALAVLGTVHIMIIICRKYFYIRSACIYRYPLGGGLL